MNELDVIQDEQTAAQKTDAMTDKVAKLLRQAEDAAKGGRPDEEQAFQIKAFEIMAKYGIDEALARSRGAGLDKKIDPKADHFYATMEGQYKPLQADFYYNLAEALHCDAVLVGGRQGKVTLHVFGMPDHLARLKIMWDLLQPQFMRGMKNAEPPFGYSHSGELRVYRRNWVRGFRDAVVDRIRKAEYDAANGAGALVLYRNDKEIATQGMTAWYPRVHKSYTRSYGNDAAYDNGRHAGNSANIQHQVGR